MSDKNKSAICPQCGCEETWFDRTITTWEGMKTRCVNCGRATDESGRGEMDWKPWLTHKLNSPDLVGINAPPCPECKYWKPQGKFIDLKEFGMQWDGVVCCHAEDMYPDFSCFRSKLAANNKERNEHERL